MASNPTSTRVVAGLIRDGEGRLLMQQCPAHKRHAGLWEFPGGKVETGETERLALAREIAEELGLTIDAAAALPAGSAHEAPADGRPGLVLILYSCPLWHGQPQALEGQSWGWFAPDEAWALPLPHMDRSLLAALLGRSAG